MNQVMPDFKEELRLQRLMFGDRYAVNPDLVEQARVIDAMYAQDEGEPITSYAERRGE